MKSIATFFTPALLLALGLVLVPGGATPAAPCPPDQPDEFFSPDVTDAAPLDTAPADRPMADANTDTDEPDTDAGTVAEARTPAGEMAALLDYLDSCARAPIQETPETVFDEIADLVDARPETAARLVAAMDGAHPRLRVWLGHIVYRIDNKALRSRLKKQWRASDPVRRKVLAILARPSTIPAALADMEPPTPLIQRLTPALLKVPAIRDALQVIAESSEDDRARGTAIYRLGRAGTPEAAAFVLAVLGDRNRNVADRRAAIGAIRAPLTAEAVGVLVSILKEEQDRGLVLNAARNLSGAVDRNEVSTALFELLLSSRSEPGARKAAAESLAEGISKLEGDRRASLETRVEGALGDLGRHESTEDLYEYALSEFVNSLGTEFKKRVTDTQNAAQAAIRHG